MQRTVEKAFFALIRFEINGDELCEDLKNLITPEMLPALFKISKRHDLAHLIGNALDKNGLLPDGTEAKKRFLQERNMAVYRYEQIQYEFEQICNVLEKAKIPFIPLKGSVIRQYYPEPWMRTSCDIDILVQQERLEEVENLLISILNYAKHGVGAHDVQFYSVGGVHLELHFSLIEFQKFEQQKKAKLVLEQVWKEVEESENFIKTLRGEFFFFYHIVHMFNHFIGGGCGVRFFIDTWIIQQFIDMNNVRFNELLRTAKLVKFLDGILQTTNVWLNKGQESSIVRDIQEYVLYAGMYGDIKNRIAIEQGKKGNKGSYVFKRLFLSYEELRFQYPIINRYKILTPIYQFARWGRLLFGKNKSKPLMELRLNREISEEQKNRAARIFFDLEIN